MVMTEGDLEKQTQSIGPICGAINRPGMMPVLFGFLELLVFLQEE